MDSCCVYEEDGGLDLGELGGVRAVGSKEGDEMNMMNRLFRGKA